MAGRSGRWRRLALEPLERRELLAVHFGTDGQAARGLEPAGGELALDQAFVQPYAAFWERCSTDGAPAAMGELVDGVTQIVSPGGPGPVYDTSGQWTPIVGGDEDSSIPSTFVLAREYGAGRVIAFGHEGIFSAVDTLDNGPFLENVTRWFDTADGRQVRYTSGHGEWVGGGSLADLAARMAGDGYSFTALPAPLTAASLAGTSVLIVGNAWGDFTPDEIEAVRQFVDAGGGLWLVGLGWSWEPYHPGTTIEDYPMMEMAAPYGVRWLRSGIQDPTNQQGGAPVFHTFYPDVPILEVSDAVATIRAAHAAHPTDLAAALESDAALRLDFIRAHQVLSIPASELPDGDPARQEVYDAVVGLATDFPQAYAKMAAFDQSAYPTATWVRERFWRTWRDCLPLETEVAATMISVGQLGDDYAAVLQEHGVVLLDNVRLGAAQVDFIDRYLDALPVGLHNLRSISVRDYLGTRPAGVSIDGLPGAINIFGIDIGDQRANPFPGDVAAISADIFISTLAHEVNHIVDAHSIAGPLDVRRGQLIADAGNEPMNYLRSMFPAGFFVGAPQEFFASISNQWFCDSAHTIELGINRFDAGYLYPINQALFFAEVYSQGGDVTWVYRIDTAGNLERTAAPLWRDGQGRINRLKVDGTTYAFEFDAADNVASIEIVEPQLVATQVFYNTSHFDGNDPLAGPDDDHAIATDKQPLLPGQTATFANYTSFGLGLNGMMVDISALAETPTLATLDDFFTFKVGNDDTPGAWTTAPAPIEVATRIVDTNDRITLIWADNELERQWLEVTVLATAATGLAAPEVFYFGNAIGECGNSPENAMVTSVDEIAARHHPQIITPAGIENLYDYNRDTMVTSIDQILARHNIAVLDALKLIDLSTPPPEAVPAPLSIPAPAALAARLEEGLTVGEPAAKFTGIDGSFDFEHFLAETQPVDDEQPAEEVVDHLLATLAD